MTETEAKGIAWLTIAFAIWWYSAALPDEIDWRHDENGDIEGGLVCGLSDLILETFGKRPRPDMLVGLLEAMDIRSLRPTPKEPPTHPSDSRSERHEESR